jgi:hypothetical protein
MENVKKILVLLIVVAVAVLIARQMSHSQQS